jgi:hypothetical protein
MCNYSVVLNLSILRYFQLEALICFSFPSLLDNYKYIPLPIFNSDDVIMSCENQNFHLSIIVKGGALHIE